MRLGRVHCSTFCFFFAGGVRVLQFFFRRAAKRPTRLEKRPAKKKRTELKRILKKRPNSVPFAPMATAAAAAVDFFLLNSSFYAKRRVRRRFEVGDIFFKFIRFRNDVLTYLWVGSCMTGFEQFHYVLLGLTMFYWVLLGFAWLEWVSLGFTGLYRVLMGFTGFYVVLLGFTGFYRVLPSFAGLY